MIHWLKLIAMVIAGLLALTILEPQATWDLIEVVTDNVACIGLAAIAGGGYIMLRFAVRSED